MFKATLTAAVFALSCGLGAAHAQQQPFESPAHEVAPHADGFVALAPEGAERPTRIIHLGSGRTRQFPATGSYEALMFGAPNTYVTR